MGIKSLLLVEMKFRQNFIILFLIGLAFVLLTGCNPHSINIVLSNDASLQRLNDLVQDRTVRVTTKDSIYNGNNILVNNDSTVVENISTEPKVIPYSSMKSIKYSKDSHMLDGIIELKNDEQINARNIYIANLDTVIKFDEVITTSVIFPTSELLKIQRRDHLHSTIKGFGYGILGGIGLGAILGTFVGSDSPQAPPGEQQAAYGTLTRGDIIGECIVAGCIFGPIIGAATGAILGQWQDINIQFDKTK
jgi:hypothetical protein